MTPPHAIEAGQAMQAAVSAAPERQPNGAEQWRECPGCGLFLILPELPPQAVGRCPRCDAVLRRHRADPVARPLVMGVTGLMLLAIISQTQFIDLSVGGINRVSTVFTGPSSLEQQGMWELAIVVLITTVLAPLTRLLAIVWVLAGLYLGPEHAPAGKLWDPARLARLFRLAETLRPWAMIEVFLLGVFVAYTRLIAIAHVDLGDAAYAMAALMLVMASIDASMDPEAIWEILQQRQSRSIPTPPSGGPLVGCQVCELVSAADAPTCPRCGSALRRRKPSSLSRTWALILAAACLYVPANILPVLTLIRLGRGAPSTIVGGAEELLKAGMWPLALLVFVASILVPVMKLASLGLMLITTQFSSAARLRERTRLYRIVDFIGRWSMIDVFMISILTALVRMGAVASVYPGPGAVAFCGVVILTMFAAISFDPRLMWDAAQQNRTRGDSDG